MQFTIPCFPLSERTTMADLMEHAGMAWDAFERQTGQTAPLLLFQPLPEWPQYQEVPKVSKEPEQLIVIAAMPQIVTHCLNGLAEVEKREPQYKQEARHRRIKINFKTPMKNLFRQMADIPLTVFSMNYPEGSVFFLRTRFTIAEFLREVEKPVDGEATGEDSPSLSK